MKYPTLILPLLLGASSLLASVHPGLLHTQQDFDRAAAKVAANAEPWISSWDRLIANSHAQLSWTPQPTTYLIRGTTSLGSENYSYAMNDAAAAYQTALRWKITGDSNYADKSVAILNDWATTCTSIEGDSNQSLAAGIYGYEFANAAEIMRSYSGWASADFATFQQWMIDVFYTKNHDFLTRHHNTCDTHYWSNWDLCNIASTMAIGVLCDNQTIYDEAVTYFIEGVGTGNIDRLIYHVHPGFLGQAQESGRDQGHATLSIALVGVICEQAWNQGLDLYGYENNRVLAGSEYVAKYNLAQNVPFTTYVNCEGEVHTVASATARGTLRAGWESLYNHYVNRMGLAAPYTADMAALLSPEGGGGDYGSTSGGFDHPGFGTLMATLDPIAEGAAPSGLQADVSGTQATLSWWGSAYATSYNVKRATSSGGPYTTIATLSGDHYGNYLIDTGLGSGNTYYYVVSANLPSGETANSPAVAASPDGRLTGTIIGSAGSHADKGATIATVFDDELGNFYDAVNATGDWAGLDLGNGVSATVNEIRYCPRANFPGRMVGGKFQGSNTADFSSGVVDLFTITSAPAEGVLTTQTVSNANTFRYLRYLGPTNGYGNVAEVQFHGTLSGLNPPAAPSDLTPTTRLGQVELNWTASAAATGYQVLRSTTTGGPYTLLGHATDTQFTDFVDLVDGATYYYCVVAFNPSGTSSLSTQVASTLPYSPVKLSGTIIGTSGSWGNNSATTKDAAMDDNTATYFDGPTSVAWVGLDLGSGNDVALTQVSFFPRTNYSSRMTGGVFQGSSTADFSSGVVTLATIATQPTEGIYTNITISDTTTFRYVRYLGPSGGYGNVAEVEFYRSGGEIAVPPAPSGLTATVVSTDQVDLSWTAASGAHDYYVKRASTSGGPYTTIASGVTGTSYSDSGLSAGSYYYVVSARNTTGEGSNSSEASATLGGQSLPQPWESLDIGSVSATGSVSYSSGTFTVAGSGSDIWSSSDAFHSVDQPASGDCEIIARVASMDNTDSQAKAGIMIRESSAANARYAGVFVTPGAGVRFQRRTKTGGSTSNTAISGITAPRYLRLVRTGNTFYAYYSNDGSSWTAISGGKSVSMSSSTSIGLAVSSRNDGTLCTAVMDNVSVTP